MDTIKMIIYKWDFLELFGNADKLVSVRYKLSGKDKDIIVESEGNHVFSEGTANKALSEIVESDIFQWIEKDTTIDGVNAIKLAIENQLKSLKISEKVDFPWLSGTFIIE